MPPRLHVPTCKHTGNWSNSIILLPCPSHWTQTSTLRTKSSNTEPQGTRASRLCKMPMSNILGPYNPWMTSCKHEPIIDKLKRLKNLWINDQTRCHMLLSTPLVTAWHWRTISKHALRRLTTSVSGPTRGSTVYECLHACMCRVG